MSIIRVVVDTREPALWQAFKDRIGSNDSIELVQKPLDVGDVLIQKGTKNDEDGAWINCILFERKTMSDLTASIKDGRYKEQKVRMLSLLPAHRVTYIIEGGYIIGNSGYGYGLAPSVYTGMYANTMYRDGIHVLYVRNTNETAQWISQVAEKLVAKPDCFDVATGAVAEGAGGGVGNVADGGAYASVCKAKVKKLDNITPKTCYLLQLAQIPGVSHKIAEHIATTYPSMSHLCSSLQNCTSRDQAVQLLAKIQLIGKKKAETIVEYLRPDQHV